MNWVGWDSNQPTPKAFGAALRKFLQRLNRQPRILFALQSKFEAAGFNSIGNHASGYDLEIAETMCRVIAAATMLGQSPL